MAVVFQMEGTSNKQRILQLKETKGMVCKYKYGFCGISVCLYFSAYLLPIKHCDF